MSVAGKTVQRNTATKNSTLQIPDTVVRRSPRIHKSIVAAQNPDSGTFLRPLSRSVPRARPALFKSSSCHNIKSSRSNSQTSLDSHGSIKESKPRKISARKPASTVALPSAVLRESNSSTSGGSNTVNGDRIYVNSDLLSRVEKEKKQYEARISELTQLTESRKMEIERLSFEVRNLREAKERAEALVQRQTSHSLKRKIGDVDPDEDSSCLSSSHPPPEPSATSGTTTSDQQSLVSGVSSLFGGETAKPSSVTNLENRIHEMEEANYTTTEELQATMGELCEMQRTLDETQEENRNLAFERAILLESLCTQTAKLEHCRLQIDQLKHLLVTSPSASAADAREARYVELYASVEEEKQILLTQNNDLAQRCESLDAECRQLSEKIESLTQETERLRKGAAPNTTVEACDDQMVVVAKTAVDAKPEVELSNQVDALTRQVAAWREKFELEVAEHEREVTELRLHERHLLKTVQVADGIRMESEAEVARITIETHELRDQVKRLSADLENALQESTNLRDQLSKSSLYQDVPPSLIEPSLPPFQPPPPPPPRVEMKNVATMTSLTETPYITLSSTNATAPATTTLGSSAVTSATPFQHLSRTTYMQKLGLNPASATVSPGGPGGSVVGSGCGGGVGAIRRTGPTVQSLIQTIENQVKAVQHQQKASAVRSPVTNAKVKLDVDGSVGDTDDGSISADTCSALPARRLHSAGSSPNSTPVRSAPRHPLLDEPLVGDLAPGGPPPPTSPSIASPATPQPPSLSQTTPTSLLRSKPIFGVSRDDTSPVKEPFLLKYSTTPSACIGPSTGTPTTTSTSTTPRLKRHLTAPTSSPSAVATKTSGAGAISEAVSSVLSAAAAAAVVDMAADPLHELAKRTDAGSKRNALLRWCQSRVAGYRGVEVTNFSSSWNDGLALCALLHTFLPQLIAPNWERVVNGMDKQRRFEVAFAAAESRGIPTTLRLSDMLTKDRPDWNHVMAYIASIYKHFEATA
ncbi:Cytospin-A [Taenia crassiceps]|uniref:Cytospin-A n=1 Tax=Taenia crassiceps TaxID=6207 RepID=A0ABR4Q9D2_9CEST